MPVVKFDRIVSCSSEDPSHPATNLLQRKDSNRKWRSKLPGEEYISVIIQLSQPYCITAIDIGNEGSAFVEVLVGRTSAPDDFQVLLLMSSFMTPMDSRSETNKNRVRIFSKEQLSESVWKEKWDRVKVVCTQPFNKHHQYGLSFLVLHSSDGKQENSTQEISPAKALGRFALKNDEDSEINVGSFFSRRKDLQASPAPPLVSLTGAAAVRDASSPANLVDKKAPKKRKGSEDMTDTQRKKKQGEPKPNVELGRPTWSNEDESQPNGTVKRGKKPEDNLNKADVSYSSTLKTDMDGRNTINDKLKASIGDKNSHSDSSHGILQHRETERMKNLTNQLPMTYKPFNKLLDGVEIVISGYQNPGRSHVRDKALAMGAKYQQNWCSSSTHLICAFPNTPKLQEAKGKGIIVTRDWIDDCYKERKKLAWRRYATEVSERKTVNSEQESEVWELIPGMNLSHVAGRRNDVATLDTRVGSDSEDSEDEIKRIKANQCLQIRKNTEDKILRTSDKRDNAMPALKKTPVKRTEEAYDCSTDVDSEEEARDRLSIWADAEKGSYKVNLPSLPDLFNNKLFHLSQELPAGERQSLLRYITAYGGKIVKSFDEPSNYIICIKKQNLLMGTETICATPEWIWECIDSQILVSPCLYKLV